MTRVSSVTRLIQKAVADSIGFSRRGASQVFVSTQPHVGSVEFQAYRGGWACRKPPVVHITYCETDGLCASQVQRLLRPLYTFMREEAWRG